MFTNNKPSLIDETKGKKFQIFGPITNTVSVAHTFGLKYPLTIIIG